MLAMGNSAPCPGQRFIAILKLFVSNDWNGGSWSSTFKYVNSGDFLDFTQTVKKKIEILISII